MGNSGVCQSVVSGSAVFITRCTAQVPPVCMFYLWVISWRLLRRGEASGFFFAVSMPAYPKGWRVLRRIQERVNLSSAKKINGKRLGMPHSQRLPPFRLRYGGVLAGKRLTTEFGDLPLHKYRLFQCFICM